MIAWIGAGTLKFLINFLRFRRRAFRYIGNGGFPSTHTTIISSTVALIGIREGINSPLFSLGVAVFILIVIDALGIRRAVGRQAAVLNRHLPGEPILRERQGHKPYEVLGGLVWGIALAVLVNWI
jgi:acid phosphatase family membrane protein YuiD